MGPSVLARNVPLKIILYADNLHDLLISINFLLVPCASVPVPHWIFARVLSPAPFFFLYLFLFVAQLYCSILAFCSI